MKILITGAAGFIGSSLLAELNERGYTELILVDNFFKPGKDRYLADKTFERSVNSPDLFDFLHQNPDVDFVFHLGGKTADKDDFINQNLLFSKRLFAWCSDKRIPMVYASSSSTYGDGKQGYSDDEEKLHALQPLNEYGKSKHEFDKWITGLKDASPFAGLKIFNVFGSNEYHKKMSASVAFKSFFEIKDTGKVVLFGSSSPAYGPGEQLRDFVYVKDVANVFCWFLERWVQGAEPFPSGIFNVGTGIGRRFNDVARAVFRAINLSENIEYKPIPEHILGSYPENTVAEIGKLRAAGYNHPFSSLEDAVDDMVRNYLLIETHL